MTHCIAIIGSIREVSGHLANVVSARLMPGADAVAWGRYEAAKERMEAR